MGNFGQLVQRSSACIIYDVNFEKGVETITQAGWASGSLPVRHIAPTQSHPLLPREVADDDLRMTYFEERVREALYGTERTAVRWNQPVNSVLAEALVFGVEVLRAPYAGKNIGLAIIHVDLGDDPITKLAALVRSTSHDDPGSGRSAVQRLLPSAVQLAVSTVGRPQTVAHVTFAGGPTDVLPAAYHTWPAVDQWLWTLAAGVSVTQNPPDPGDDDLFTSRVRLSADWQALVLRDGTSFVGVSPDPGNESTFHASARSYVHSIYLDTLLLGRMQVVALSALANRIAERKPDRLTSTRLAALEHNLIEIRRILWSQSITSRIKANALLQAFQQQHHVEELLDLVRSDLGDASRFVEAQTNRSINAFLGLVSTIAFPLGLAFSGGAIWGDASPQLFLGCTGLAVLLAIATVVGFSQVRQMVAALRAGEAGHAER
jgi:hypothetical protein